MLKTISESRHPCRTIAISCAAMEQDCSLSLVIRIFNDMYDDDMDVVFQHNWKKKKKKKKKEKKKMKSPC